MDADIVAVGSPEVEVTAIGRDVAGKARVRAADPAFRVQTEEAYNSYVAALLADLRNLSHEFLHVTYGGRWHSVKSLVLRSVLRLLKA